MCGQEENNKSLYAGENTSPPSSAKITGLINWDAQG